MDANPSSPTTITPPARISRRELDEQAALAIVQAAGDIVCYRCRDAGYLNSAPIRNAFGPLAWQLAGVPVDDILWCDCPTGEAWRRRYAAGLQDVTQERLDASFQRAGIPARFNGLSFESIPAQHRTGKEAAISAAREFAEHGHVTAPNGKRKRGLAFIGRPGVGKTGLLSVAFRARLAAGVSGLWIELYAFFGEIQSQYGKKDGMADEKLREAQRADLIMLDDCGDPDRCTTSSSGVITVSAETDDRRRLLWEIVDHRHGRGLPTLVTSNLSRSDFELQWGTRLAARLWELCQVVPVTGVDLRSVDL